MSEEKRKKDELKELQSIRNLLILQLLKNGTPSEEIDLATGMGASNIRGKFPNVKLFPGVKKRGKSQNGN
jgi:hypothetical protein